MSITSIATRRQDRAVDQAALTVFDLIRQFNDPKRQHLLSGYFSPDDDLGKLDEKARTAQSHTDKAMEQLREALFQLKMLREALDCLMSQSRKG